MTPPSEGDEDPEIVHGDSPTPKWMKRQRRAKLLDLLADEDSSDEEDWTAVQRRVDAEILRREVSSSGGLPLA